MRGSPSAFTNSKVEDFGLCGRCGGFGGLSQGGLPVCSGCLPFRPLPFFLTNHAYLFRFPRGRETLLAGFVPGRFAIARFGGHRRDAAFALRQTGFQSVELFHSTFPFSISVLPRTLGLRMGLFFLAPARRCANAARPSD